MQADPGQIRDQDRPLDALELLSQGQDPIQTAVALHGYGFVRGKYHCIYLTYFLARINFESAASTFLSTSGKGSTLVGPSGTWTKHQPTSGSDHAASGKQEAESECRRARSKERTSRSSERSATESCSLSSHKRPIRRQWRLSSRRWPKSTIYLAIVSSSTTT